MAKDIIYGNFTLDTPLEDQALNEEFDFDNPLLWISNNNGIGFGGCFVSINRLIFSTSLPGELISGKLDQVYPQGSYDIYYNKSVESVGGSTEPIYFGFSPSTSGTVTTGSGRALVPDGLGMGKVTITGSGYITLENIVPEGSTIRNSTFDYFLVVPAGSVSMVDVEDIIISNGDFLLAEAENSGELRNYHAESIVLDSKGQWYQSPLVGVGIRLALNGNTNPFLRSEIVKQLSDDNFKIKRINVIFTGGVQQIEIDADKG